MHRGKSDRLPSPQIETIVAHEIANVCLASSVPLPPAPWESASIVPPATAVEPTFDRSLCVETFPGMSLGPAVETELSDTRASGGCDASVSWRFSPESIPVKMAEPWLVFGMSQSVRIMRLQCWCLVAIHSM